ncbi:hypothetical protein QJS10_CPA01g01137 [Acorus calamus]|uniref:SPRY domain-containing protein n=1 Tax=Acorus calamus TaxID=4465 RepID=A0AAV9FMC4_ACOCL|nr:hypothetical protein QJS10_CPA01g01137 [Acorus calamus]
MASTKHSLIRAEEAIEETELPEAKRARVPDSDRPRRVELNPADCDLDFNIEGNGLQGHALFEGGFAYCWSGARAIIGITGGKYCFGCKIISEQKVVMDDTDPDQQNICRIGISRGDVALANLGESAHSFGFGGTGKFSNAKKFVDYGIKFGVGDTIVCTVDLESKPLASIGFSKNGKWLGTAMQFDAGPKGLGVVDSPQKKLQWESAVYPHVLLKNVVVELQFAIDDGLVPEDGYKPWNTAIDDGIYIIGPSFPNISDVELLMMVGLPASGKSTWAEKWVKDHPEKRYVLLGTNLVLDQMKVPGLTRKSNYGERFDWLMDRATGIFNALLARAAKTCRNYILDQTNVYKNARKRKLKEFINHRKIALVIFPTPDELKFRARKRFTEMGKEVPAEAVNEMLANYVIPTSKDIPGSDELFDQVIFLELNREDSQRYLNEMKRELRSGSELDVKSNYSPYAHVNSVPSLTNSSTVDGRVLPAVVDHYVSHIPLPTPNYDQSLQPVNPSFSSAESYDLPGFHGESYQPGSFCPSHSIDRDSSYSDYTSGSPWLRSQISPVGYQSGVIGPSHYIPGDDFNSYQSFTMPGAGVNDAYCRPNLEIPSSFPRNPFSYNSPVAAIRDPIAPRADFQSQPLRGPPNQFHAPFSSAYGPPYGAHPPPPTHGDIPSAVPRADFQSQPLRGSPNLFHAPLTSAYGPPYGAHPPPTHGAIPSVPRSYYEGYSSPGFRYN